VKRIAKLKIYDDNTKVLRILEDYYDKINELIEEVNKLRSKQ